MNPAGKITCPYCSDDNHKPVLDGEKFQCLRCFRIFNPEGSSNPDPKNQLSNWLSRCPLCGGEIKNQVCQKCLYVLSDSYNESPSQSAPA